MKIAFILPSLDNKGPIVAAENLIKAIKNKVDLIEVFYFNSIVELDLNVKCTKIFFLKKKDFSKFDIINSYMAKSDIYTSLFLRNDMRVVSTMHNYLEKDLDLLYPGFKSFVFKSLWKWSLNYKNNFIVSSNDMLSYYKDLLNKDAKTFSIIQYGVEKKDLNIIEKKDLNRILELKDKYKIIGSVGLLIYRKGYHQLVNFLKVNKNYAVVIIGDGEEKENLYELIKSNDLEDRFILLGYKNNSSDFYQYFDMYAMTSYSEGCSFALLEALSQSLPLICSDIPNHRSCFNKDEIKFFKLDDEQSLENAILKTNENIEYYKKSAYKLWQDKFSLDAMGSKHIELYKKVINDQN